MPLSSGARPMTTLPFTKRSRGSPSTKVNDAGTFGGADPPSPNAAASNGIGRLKPGSVPTEDHGPQVGALFVGQLVLTITGKDRSQTPGGRRRRTPSSRQPVKNVFGSVNGSRSSGTRHAD